MASSPKLPLTQKFSLSKLLEEARKRQTCGTKLSSPILARCCRSTVKTNPTEPAPPSLPLSCKADVRLYCKNQLFLQIVENGSVGGTADHMRAHALLQVQTVSENTVLIYSANVHKYLAMDNSGKLYSRDRPNDETSFHHVHESNDFHTFASNKYYKENIHDMFVALRKDGHTRKATKTLRLHKSSQFLLI